MKRFVSLLVTIIGLIVMSGYCYAFSLGFEDQNTGWYTNAAVLEDNFQISCTSVYAGLGISPFDDHGSTTNVIDGDHSLFLTSDATADAGPAQWWISRLDGQAFTIGQLTFGLGYYLDDDDIPSFIKIISSSTDKPYTTLATITRGDIDTWGTYTLLLNSEPMGSLYIQTYNSGAFTIDDIVGTLPYPGPCGCLNHCPCHPSTPTISNTVPEPSTIALVLTGLLLVIGYVGYRRYYEHKLATLEI